MGFACQRVDRARSWHYILDRKYARCACKRAYGFGNSCYALTLGTWLHVWYCGLLVVFVGLSQQSWLVGSAHWVIQVLHLLIGLLAIGIGEMIGARYKRLNVVRAQTM